MDGKLTAGAIAGAGCVALALAIAASAAGHDERRGSPVMRELIVPSGWEGEWSISLDTRDPATGNLLSIDEGTSAICAGDRLGLSLYMSPREGTRCDGSIDGDDLDLTCAAKFVHGHCRIGFRIDVNVARHLDTITGTGEWRIAETAGDCSTVLAHASAGESLRLAGVRTGTNPGGCSEPPSSLIEKVLSQPELIALLRSPVAGLVARADGRTVRLTWPPVAEAKVYEIHRAHGDGRFKPIATVSSRHRPSFRDTHLRRGVEYRYVVSWSAPDGRVSPMSNEVAVTP